VNEHAARGAAKLVQETPKVVLRSQGVARRGVLREIESTQKLDRANNPKMVVRPAVSWTRGNVSGTPLSWRRRERIAAQGELEHAVTPRRQGRLRGCRLATTFAFAGRMQCRPHRSHAPTSPRAQAHDAIAAPAGRVASPAVDRARRAG